MKCTSQCLLARGSPFIYFVGFIIYRKLSVLKVILNLRIASAGATYHHAWCSLPTCFISRIAIKSSLLFTIWLCVCVCVCVWISAEIPPLYISEPQYHLGISNTTLLLGFVGVFHEMLQKNPNELWDQPYSKYGEGNGTPLQYSCLENPVDLGAWWAAVHGVTQSWTQLKRLSIALSNKEMHKLQQMRIWIDKNHFNHLILSKI